MENGTPFVSFLKRPTLPSGMFQNLYATAPEGQPPRTCRETGDAGEGRASARAGRGDASAGEPDRLTVKA